MPLTLYSRYLFYPMGGPAANKLIPVVLVGGNVLVPVFSDPVSGTPLGNPVETDDEGLLSFYAPPGNYAALFGGEVLHVPIDESDTSPAFPGLFVHSQGSPATTWIINHHFGVEPDVTVLIDGAVVQAEVAHTDGHTATITFGSPTAGIAHLRR